MIEAVQALDDAVNAGLSPLRHAWLLVAFAWLTGWGTGATAVAVAVAATGLLLAGGRGRLVPPLWLTLGGAEAATWTAKMLVHRARPAFLPGFTAASFSFPSAHASVSISLYGFLGLLVAASLPGQRRRVLALAGLAVLLIGFSRLLLGVHYLSDVLGGYLVGGLALAVGWRWAAGCVAPAAQPEARPGPGAKG